MIQNQPIVAPFIVPTILDYWRKQLIPNPPVIELPCDGLRSALTQGSGARIRLPLGLRSPLADWCRLSGLTQDIVLLAVFKILLYRYTDETTLLVSTPLLVRTEILPDSTGWEVCRSVQAACSEAQAHGEIPLDGVMAELQPDRDLRRNPLTLLQFSIANEHRPSHNFEGSIAHDLDIAMIASESDWQMDIGYRSSLFRPESIVRLVGHYQQLLLGLIENPNGLMAHIPMLTVAERQQMLMDWNQTETSFFPGFSPDRGIHDYIEQQVDRTPDAIALRYEIQGQDDRVQIITLTYQDLNRRANQLAHYLQALFLKNNSDRDTTIVAVCTDRSPEMVIAFLGILKAGAAYLPLDPSYPPDRRLYQLQDSNARVVLTQAHLEPTIVPKSFGGKVLCLDRDWTDELAACPTTNPFNVTTADTLAYVIYTSGSTGTPKGVMIPHGGLVNHCFAMRQVFELTARDRMLQFSSMSFDIIIEELYPTLVTGAMLVLRTDAIAASISEFIQFVTLHYITVLDLPTAFWHELVRGIGALKMPLPDCVRLVVVGGEKASKSLYQQWLTQFAESGSSPVRWLNTYGPTETTVSATAYDPIALNFDLHQPDIPIGRPIANIKTYVLDRNLNPVPVNVAGELYIGGAGVAQGYLNAVEKSAQSFIPNLFTAVSGDRMYRTGDRVRYLADGTLEFVGRRDFQVKIRGYRVELGEIERELEAHPHIQQAVVGAPELKPGQKTLVAYVLLSDLMTLSGSEMKSFLQAHLPDYLIPGFFVSVQGFPLTPNGKVDRMALPDFNRVIQCTNRRDLARPEDDFEAELLAIWSEILGRSDISVTDNFFDLGGYSLLVLQLLLKIETQWHRSLPITVLFQAPTIRQLAVFLHEDSPPPRAKIVPFREQGTQPPIFSIPGARGNLFFAHELANQLAKRSVNLAADRPVYGLQERLKSDGPLPTHIDEVAALYLREVQAIQPEGPYHLVGYSIGGLIAYEMAQQLRQHGHEVALLGLLDPTPPYAAIRSRRRIQEISVHHPVALLSQLSLLKGLSLVETYKLRIRPMPNHQIPIYLSQELRTWSRSGAVQSFWQRFQKIAGISRTTSHSEVDRDPLQVNYDEVMKYERAVLYYLPKPYSGPLKLFVSEEWCADAANRISWDRLAHRNLECHALPGPHTRFYKGTGMSAIVQQLLVDLVK